MPSFKKSFKKIKKQKKEEKELWDIVEKLANGETLPPKNKDHELYDNKYYKNCRECHIKPDWLLIYRRNHKELLLVLVVTGSHSELF